MPWLSRRNSSLNGGESVDFHPVKVTYVPSMLDGACGTTPVHHRHSPMAMLTSNVRLMVQNLLCLPQMLSSMYGMSFWRSAIHCWVDAGDFGLQMMLGMLQMSMMFVAIPTLVVLPGIMTGVIFAACVGIIAVLAMFMNGEQVVRFRLDKRISDDRVDEKWVFINGPMTSSHKLMLQLQRLSSIFSRSITGIHNRTHGPVIDFCSQLLPGIPLSHSASAALHRELRDALLLSTSSKVVILAHSTGAAILSHTLDRLHADLPLEILYKLEIYTFGSAAQHLSNPCLNPANTFDSSLRVDEMEMQNTRTEASERVIPHIEHYAFTSDLLARTGILHHTLTTLDNRFCGRLFSISSSYKCGFLFDQYLDLLFPLQTKYEGSSPGSTSEKNMLDEIPHIDISTAEKREFTAQGVSSIMRKLNLASTSPSRKERQNSWSIKGSDSVAWAKESAREAEGKSVRQLSRLWRYAGDMKIPGEGVAKANGVGNFAVPKMIENSERPAATWTHIPGLEATQEHRVMM